MESSALIIIDVQNDIMVEGGSVQVKNANQILPYINSLRKKFKTIFLTQEYHLKDHVSFADTHHVAPYTKVKLENRKEQDVFPIHCVQGSWGCEFNKDLVTEASDIIIQKGIYKDCCSFSGFGSAPEKTKLDELLKEKGIKNVFLVGLCFDFCVKATAIDGTNLGYNMFIVKEGTKALSENGEKQTLEILKQKNIPLISMSEVDKHI